MDIIEHIGPRVRESHELIIYENGTSEYTYRHIDSGPAPDITELLANGGISPANKEFTFEDMQERIDRGNKYKEWENQMRAAGLHFASEEQAQRVMSVLQDMMPRVKWWLTEPTTDN